MSYEELKNLNNATKFQECMKNQELLGKVVNVYDGDTVKIIMPLNNKYYKWNCRLIGIDTPEIRTKSMLEKVFGLQVRDRLREKILDKIVLVICDEFDKYGRLLVNIKLQDEDITINKWLIDNNFAFEYIGGTKRKWSEYLEKKQK